MVQDTVGKNVLPFIAIIVEWLTSCSSKAQGEFLHNGWHIFTILCLHPAYSQNMREIGIGDRISGRLQVAERNAALAREL